MSLVRSFARTCVLLVASIAVAPPLAAAPPQFSVESGFDRIIRGTYAPVRVTITTTDEGFEGELRVHYRLTEAHALLVRAVSVPPKSTHAESLCVPIDAPGRPLTLRAVSRDGHAEDFPLETRWTAGTRLVLSITENPGGLDLLGDAVTPSGAQPGDPEAAKGPTWEISYFKPVSAPVHWQSYQGVDAVVLHLPEPARFKEAQVRALRRWVELGGHLLVALSAKRPVTLDGNWLGELLPCTVEGNVDLGSLEDLDRKEGVTPKPTGAFSVARLVPAADAATAAMQGTAVLACSRPLGGGTVTAVAFDYQSVPFSSQPSVARLLGRMAGSSGPILWRTLEYDLSARLAQDLTAQFALDWQIAVWLLALLFVYLLLIRPLQRRVLGPPLTPRRVLLLMPAIPLVVSVLVAAYVLLAPGAAPAVRTLGLLVLRPASALAEAHVYLTVFSPVERETSVRYDEPDTVLEQECGNKLDLALAGGYRYRQEDEARVDGIKLLPSIPRTFLTVGARPLAGPLEVRLERGDAKGTWTLSGRNLTGVDLEDVRIAFVGKEAIVGTWKAGAAIERTPLAVEDLIQTAASPLWSGTPPDLRAAVLRVVYNQVDLHRLPQPGEEPRKAHLVAWGRLPPDARIDAPGVAAWQDETLFYLELRVPEAK